MTKWLLNFFVVSAIQEYSFLNFCIIAIAFGIFHPEVLVGFYNESSMELKLLALTLVLFYLYRAYSIVTNQKPERDAGMRSWIVFSVIWPISLIAAVASLIAHEEAGSSQAERLFTDYALIRYGISALVLTIYLRLGGRGDSFTDVIRGHMAKALGKYQVTTREAFMLVVAGMALVYAISLSSANRYSQFMLAFMILNVLAHAIESTRRQGITFSFLRG